MKSLPFILLCFILSACFLFDRTVNFGETFTLEAGETVRFNEKSLKLKVTSITIRDYADSTNKKFCGIEVKYRDKSDQKELESGKMWMFEDFEIKLESVNAPSNSHCRFTVEKWVKP